MRLVERTLASADASSRISAVKWLHGFLLREGVGTDLGRRALRLMLVSTRDRDPEVRVEAISRLPRGPAFAKILTDGLADQSPDVRRATALSLSWYWRDPAVHDEILRAAGDKDNMVRLAVATTLVRQWEAKITALMIKETGQEWPWVEDQWVSDSILPQIQGYVFDILQLQNLVRLAKTGNAFARHTAQTVIDKLKEPQRLGVLMGGSGRNPLEIWRVLEESDDARGARMALLKSLLLYPYGVVGYVASKGLDDLGLLSISETYRAAYSGKPSIELLKRSRELNKYVREILSSPDFTYGDRERTAYQLDRAYPISETLAFDFPRYRSWMAAVDESLAGVLAKSDGELAGMLTETMAEIHLDHPQTTKFISMTLEMVTRRVPEAPEVVSIPPLPTEELRMVEEQRPIPPIEPSPIIPQREVAPMPPVFMPAPPRVEAEVRAAPTFEDKSMVEESRRHYAVGTSLYDRGEYDGAISEFQAALAADPKFARAHLMIGQIKETLGDKQAAEASYRASISANPEVVEARYKLARILLARGEIVEPTEQLRQVVLLNPTDWKSRVELDRLLIRDKKFAEALPDLRSITANRQDVSEAHGLAGIVYYHEGKFSEAQAELETAIRYRPADVADMSVFHFFLALVRQERGDSNGAVKDLKSALYYDPGNSMARAELHLINGRVFASRGKTSDARRAFKAAIDYDPVYADARGARRDLEALPDSGAAEKKGGSSVFEEL